RWKLAHAYLFEPGKLTMRLQFAGHWGVAAFRLREGPASTDLSLPHEDMARAVNTPGETFDRTTSGIWPKVLCGQLRPSAQGTPHPSWKLFSLQRAWSRSPKWATRPNSWPFFWPRASGNPGRS